MSTLIAAAIDMSGSIEDANLTDVYRDKFNEYVGDLERNGGFSLAVTTFNTNFEQPCPPMRLDAKHTFRLTHGNYRPRGGTALLDAIHHMVVVADAWLEQEHKLGRDYTVLGVILTDGFENSSSTQTRESIKKLIAEHELGCWKFVYLGANQDAFTEAVHMGIGVSSGYVADAAGVAAAYNSLSQTSYRYANTGEVKI